MTRPALILGGTAEGRALALACAARGVAAITSLAGRTSAPQPVPGEVRSGGFGGVAGLVAFLETRGISAVVDATHPFAVRITANAVAACERCRVRYLRLERPAWRPGTGDRWHELQTLGAAARLLATLGSPCFTTVAGPGLEELAPLPIRFVLRTIKRPPILPANVDWLGGRPPYSVADETAFLTARRYRSLLVRAAGGEGGRAKLIAARALGLPVVLLARPPAPAAPIVEDAQSALAWLEGVLGRST